MMWKKISRNLRNTETITLVLFMDHTYQQKKNKKKKQ